MRWSHNDGSGRSKRALASAITLALAVTAMARAGAADPGKKPSSAAVPRYDHVFLIIEENHGFSQIADAGAPPLRVSAAERACC